MKTTTNEDRANRAASTLDYYTQFAPLVVSDLLADLMHYCDQYAIDFYRELQDAQWNYREEVKEEGK